MQGVRAARPSGFPRQDGDFGRDALARAGQLTKIGGGEAGFDFTKISNSGQPFVGSCRIGCRAERLGLYARRCHRLAVGSESQ